MVNYLDTKEEKKAWLTIYRTIKTISCWICFRFNWYDLNG